MSDRLLCHERHGQTVHVANMAGMVVTATSSAEQFAFIVGDMGEEDDPEPVTCCFLSMLERRSRGPFLTVEEYLELGNEIEWADEDQLGGDDGS